MAAHVAPHVAKHHQAPHQQYSSQCRGGVPPPRPLLGKLARACNPPARLAPTSGPTILAQRMRGNVSSLFLSCLVLACLVLPCLAVSRLVSSCLLLFCPFLYRRILLRPIPYNPQLPFTCASACLDCALLVLSYRILYCLVLRCLRFETWAWLGDRPRVSLWRDDAAPCACIPFLTW